MFFNQQLSDMLSNCLQYGFKDDGFSYLLNYNITLTNPRNRVSTIPHFGELDFYKRFCEIKKDFESAGNIDTLKIDNTPTKVFIWAYDLTFIKMDGKLNMILEFEQASESFEEEFTQAIYSYSILHELYANSINLELGVMFINIPIVKLLDKEYIPSNIIELEMSPITSENFEENLQNFDGTEENFLKIFNII